MKLFRKIDTTTGIFLEDVLFESHPIVMEESIWESMDELGVITPHSEWVPVLDAEGNTILDAQFVEEAPAQGFYLPRWNGTEWEEGGQAPEPTVPKLSTDEKLTQMAEQLVITQTELGVAQEALDFLFIGRNVKWRDVWQ